jgi:hypothetical protein
MRLAVEHLAGPGHRRIAGPQEISTGALRRAGWSATSRDNRSSGYAGGSGLATTASAMS